MSVFKEVYKCFATSTMDAKRENIRHGGKIILPQSALVKMPLFDLPSPPMLFKLINNESQKSTHAGVLEFTADEGTCWVPDWLQNFLNLENGDKMKIEYVSLPVATFAKFQPIGVDFLDITNPKAVLESELRHFACLTVDDVIAIYYNNRIYELRVLELKPARAVSIIVCDMNVEFAQPEGYIDPNAINNDPSFAGLNIITSFEGKGVRLDGKEKKTSEVNKSKTVRRSRGVPDFSYRFGELRFIRNNAPTLNAPTEMQENNSTIHFPGNGFTVQVNKGD